MKLEEKKKQVQRPSKSEYSCKTCAYHYAPFCRCPLIPNEILALAIYGEHYKLNDTTDGSNMYTDENPRKPGRQFTGGLRHYHVF